MCAMLIDQVDAGLALGGPGGPVSAGVMQGSGRGGRSSRDDMDRGGEGEALRKLVEVVTEADLSEL